VTETASVTQIGLANLHLAGLRRAGFQIAIDDFGSGYSSVRYLANMPVDVVKFDISLVQGLRDENQGRMVRHLAQMILEFGHRLVAEGIEDRATLDVAIAAGFDMGQGHLLGRPAATVRRTRMPLDNVTPFPSGRRA
jgi:EAL domain-containing protein (putative c-di-GMP-specific phosphodiesterase class I)